MRFLSLVAWEFVLCREQMALYCVVFIEMEKFPFWQHFCHWVTKMIIALLQLLTKTVKTVCESDVQGSPRECAQPMRDVTPSPIGWPHLQNDPWMLLDCRREASIDLTHILQGCFTGTGAIIWLPQCQWSNPEGYGQRCCMNPQRTDDITTNKPKHNITIHYVHILWVSYSVYRFSTELLSQNLPIYSLSW